MMRLRRTCLAAVAVAALGGPVVGASLAEAASEPHYSLYADFVKLGKLSIDPSTHECTVEGIVQLVGECSAGSTFSATLHIPSGFLDVGLTVEALAQRKGHVAYAGSGRLNLEFAGHPPVWVEVRQAS